MTCFAKSLEPSSRAALPDGPKHGMPLARTASATPATSGASGPTTTRSASTSTASPATASGDRMSTSRCSVATSAIPGLPGAAITAVTPGSRTSPSTRACSRPPPPTTSTRTPPPYPPR